MSRPTMHCQDELERSLGYEDVLPDEILLQWFNDRYSTSKHLLTLYSIARGLQAKKIVEIGFGRSSFVLAKAAFENKGEFLTCDQRDFSYLLNETERSVTTFVQGNSDVLWQQLEEGVDFAFLDYFSAPGIHKDFVIHELNMCLHYLKENGIIAIHDTIVEKYNIDQALDHFKTKWRGLRPNIDLEICSLPFNYGLGLIRRRVHSEFGEIHDQFIKKDDTYLDKG